MKFSDKAGRTKLIAISLAGLVVVGGGAVAVQALRHGGEGAATTQGQKRELYRCPMHPSVTSDHPDRCPICHMDLQKVDDEDLESAPAPAAKIGGACEPDKKDCEQKKPLYRCPMHPSVTDDKPSQCPVCHMDLQKVDDDEAEESASAASTEAPQNISGRTGFSLSLEKQQLIGVATTKVAKHHLSHEVHATGRVAFDPDLFTALEEYRQAMMTRTQMEASPYDALKTQSNELVNSARTKLRLMGLGDAQIRALAKQPSDSMSLLLPGGSVWIYAEVFEYEIGGLKAGQKIDVTSPSVPGKTFQGKIASISPIVNSPTRTIRVRAQVPNPQGLLRPDTFVNVKINIEYGEKLSVPEDAVLHSGHENFVFIVKGKGRFEPRAVGLGVKAGNTYEILSGLEEGESVVTAANFLIDSESRMRAALQTMKSDGPAPASSAAPAGGDGGSSQGNTGHAGHNH